MSDEALRPSHLRVVEDNGRDPEDAEDFDNSPSQKSLSKLLWHWARADWRAREAFVAVVGMEIDLMRRKRLSRAELKQLLKVVGEEKA